MLLLATTTLGVAISVKVIPNAFTIDDVNYLTNVVALRGARFTISNTEGLSPTRELLFFDPTAQSRAVTSTPVASTAPPLYALLALPFSVLGWRGLVALNTLGYLVTILVVFIYAGRYASTLSAAWIASAAFALGGFALEYAMGLWPHGLSLALCTIGIVALSRVIDGTSRWSAPMAGLFLGAAAGIRYQNVAILVAAGATIALFEGRRRWRALAMYALASAGPLVLCAAINHVRIDSWNPISKGPGYLSLPLATNSPGSMLDPLRMFWGQVLDYSVRPPITAPEAAGSLTYDVTTGAHLLFNATMKKAFLQSAPWAALAFAFLILAWMPRAKIPAAQRQQARMLSLIALVVFAVFSFAGPQRHDGLSFNQRYLLEILPLTAVAFAWAIDALALVWPRVFLGGLIGSALVLTILLGTPVEGGPTVSLWLVRQLLILKVPLVLSSALVVCWVLARSGRNVRSIMSVLTGVCLGWGLALHLADDVFAAQRLRADNLVRMERLSTFLTDGSAFVAYQAGTLAAAPLLLQRDIVILDAAVDGGIDAPMLIRELLIKGRRVFVLKDGFPQEMLDRVVAGFDATATEAGQGLLLEVRMKAR